MTTSDDEATEDITFSQLESEWVEALKMGDVDKLDDGSIYSDVGSKDDSAVGEELKYDWYDDNDMVEDLKGEENIIKILENYELEHSMFADSELEDFLKTEKILMKRADRKYYSSKLVYHEIYKKLTKVMKPHTTRDALKILNYTFKTQKSEAMNMSVKSYAPKGKTFCTADALKLGSQLWQLFKSSVTITRGTISLATSILR